MPAATMPRILAGLLALTLLAGCARTPRPVASSGDPERDAAQAAVTAAMTRHDYPQAIQLVNAWSGRHPNDLEFRRYLPLLYVQAGDVASWDRARDELFRAWARMKGTAPAPATPSFTIDGFKHGSQTLVAEQCYERAGRFGVIYRFNVFGSNGRVASFFTVESSDADNQIAQQMGQKYPVVTVDYFVPGRHETVAILQGLPPYQDLRARVEAYIDKPAPVSSSATPSTALATVGCEIAASGR